MKLALTVLLAGSLLCRADETATGRWEGKLQIPGLQLPLVVDLAQEEPRGAWNGSITIPGLNVKGVALTDIALKGSDISVAIKGAFASPHSGSAKLNGRFAGDGTLTGNFLQAENSAPFALRKTGSPQVETASRSTKVSKDLEGEWKGEYELFGYKRQVTLKLASHSDTGATAQFVVVGKRVNNLPVDLVTQEGKFLTVDSHETGLSYEGRLSNGELAGAIIQGGIESRLVLRRSK